MGPYYKKNLSVRFLKMYHTSLPIANRQTEFTLETIILFTPSVTLFEHLPL